MRLTPKAKPTAPMRRKNVALEIEAAGRDRPRWRPQLRPERDPVSRRRHLDRGRHAHADPLGVSRRVDSGDRHVIQIEPAPGGCRLRPHRPDPDIGPLFLGQDRRRYERDAPLRSGKAERHAISTVSRPLENGHSSAGKDGHADRPSTAGPEPERRLGRQREIDGDRRPPGTPGPTASNARALQRKARGISERQSGAPAASCCVSVSAVMVTMNVLPHIAGEQPTAKIAAKFVHYLAAWRQACYTALAV